MDIRFAASPKEVKGMNTEELRANFLLPGMMQADAITLTYSHYDRMIIGSTKPVTKPVTLPNEDELKADYFLQRRELGIINVGGTGTVTADGTTYELNKLDAYILAKAPSRLFSKVKATSNHRCFILSLLRHIKLTL